MLPLFQYLRTIVLLTHLIFCSSFSFDGYILTDLASTDSTAFQQEAQNWTLPTPFSSSSILTCLGLPMLGGNPIATSLQTFNRTYDSLLPHKMIYGTITVWGVDWSSSEGFKLTVGSLYIQEMTLGNSLTDWSVNSCKTGSDDTGPIQILFATPHSTTSIIISFQSSFRIAGATKAIGFRDITLIFSNVTKDVSTLSGDYCQLSQFSNQEDACMCLEGTYYATDSYSCEPCDPGCGQCYGSDSTQCYSCNSGAFYDGTSCIQCDPSCLTCSGNLENQCLSCQTGWYLYSNGTCQDSCDAPLFPIVENSITYCQLGCPTGEYLYQNDTCLTGCNPPYVMRSQNGIQYCDFPCSSSDFLSFDGTCVSFCNSPNLTRAQGQEQYCDFPCNSNKFLTYNNTCQASCSYPYTSRVVGTYKYCDLPCTSGLFLYPNTSCLPQCLSPWQQDQYNDVLLCEGSCPDPSLYLYSNGSCETNCLIPFLQIVENQQNLCNFPCTPSEILYYNNTCLTASCQSPFRYEILGSSEYRFCDTPCSLGEFYHPNGSCISECPSPLLTNLVTYICDSPCAAIPSYYYDLDNKTCIPDCKTPLNSGIKETVKVCSASASAVSSTGSSQAAQPQTGLKMVVQVTSVLGNIMGIGSAFQVTLATANPSAMGLSILTGSFQYIRYLEIGYSVPLNYMLENAPISPFWIVFGPSLPTSTQAGFTMTKIPSIYERYGFHSRFLINFWQPFTCMLIVFGAGLISWFLFRLFKKLKFKGLVEIARALRILTRWNLFLLMFCSYTSSLVLYAMFEFTSPAFETFWDGMSFLICIGCVVLFAWTFYMIGNIASKWMQLKRTVVPVGQGSPVKVFKREWQAFQVLFSEYNDHTIYAKAFLIAYLARVVVIYVIIAVAVDYPFAEATTITGTSIFVIGYLMKLKPLKKGAHFQVMVYETLMLVVNIPILILAIFDKIAAGGCELQAITDPDSLLRTVICYVIIFANTIFVIITLFFLASDFLKGTKYCWAVSKTLKSKGCRFWLQLLVIVFESGGMGYQQIDLQETSPSKQIATFQPGDCSVHNKSSISNFSGSGALNQDLGQSRSISPLLRRSEDISPMSGFSLSCSKLTQGDGFGGENDANTKDLNESEAKSPIRRRVSRRISLLRVNPLAFWTEAKKTEERSTKIVEADEGKFESPKEVGAELSSPSPQEAVQDVVFDFESVPLRKRSMRPRAVHKESVDSEKLGIMSQEDNLSDENKKNQDEFKFELQPVVIRRKSGKPEELSNLGNTTRTESNVPDVGERRGSQDKGKEI